MKQSATFLSIVLLVSYHELFFASEEKLIQPKASNRIIRSSGSSVYQYVFSDSPKDSAENSIFAKFGDAWEPQAIVTLSDRPSCLSPIVESDQISEGSTSSDSLPSDTSVTSLSPIIGSPENVEDDAVDRWFASVQSGLNTYIDESFYFPPLRSVDQNIYSIANKTRDILTVVVNFLYKNSGSERICTKVVAPGITEKLKISKKMNDPNVCIKMVLRLYDHQRNYKAGSKTVVKIFSEQSYDSINYDVMTFYTKAENEKSWAEKFFYLNKCIACNAKCRRAFELKQDIVQLPVNCDRCNVVKDQLLTHACINAICSYRTDATGGYKFVNRISHTTEDL